MANNNYLRCLLRSKISAAQKSVGNMWYFQRNGFIFKVKILKEVRFSESLLRGSLPKSGPLDFATKNTFPLFFVGEEALVGVY